MALGAPEGTGGAVSFCGPNPQLVVATPAGTFHVSCAPSDAPMAGAFRTPGRGEFHEVRLDERPLEARTARLLAAALLAIADEVDRLNAPPPPRRFGP